jgi:hypothetical protein
MFLEWGKKRVTTKLFPLPLSRFNILALIV